MVVYIFAAFAATDHSQSIENPRVPKRKQTSEDVIRIHNAVFYAYHGVLSDEQTLGGKFEVDVELRLDLSRGARADDLQRTVNYEQVYDSIKQLVLGKKYKLIEALAETIADGLLGKFKKVQKVVVRVRKPSAPVKGVIDHIEVEIARARS